MSRIYRGGIYLLGVVLLILGITFNVKAGLGVSPITSISFSPSEIWGISLGITTFGVYCILTVVQIIVVGRLRPTEWLQLPASVGFSALLDYFLKIIPYDCASESFLLNCSIMIVSIVLTGAGVALMANMQLLLTPADGVVYTLAWRVGREMGLVKNIVDVACVMLTCLFGLVFAGEIVGIGIGTLVAMIGTGRVIALVNKFGRERMRRMAGLDSTMAKPVPRSREAVE